MSEINKGDYVLATKFSDGDPGDPWAVGYVNEIRNDRFFVGDETTHSFRVDGYMCCVKIPSDLGEWLLKNSDALERSPPGSIDLLKMVETERNKEYEDE